jgi:hypothetical protein
MLEPVHPVMANAVVVAVAPRGHGAARTTGAGQSDVQDASA